MRARLAGQSQDAAELGNALMGLEASAAELGALERERASADDNSRTANRIVAERRLSEAEDQRRLANVRVIQPAEEPQIPRSTPLLVIAAGFVLSLLAGAASFLARFIFDPVFLTEEGLASFIDLPVLAVFERRGANVGGLVPGIVP
jgi:capsular polysaccharide biosynthesis protein